MRTFDRSTRIVSMVNFTTRNERSFRMSIRYNFSSALLHARTDRNLTQEQAAEKLGISPRWLQKLEKGTSGPNIELTCKIVKEFKIDLSACVPKKKNG